MVLMMQQERMMRVVRVVRVLKCRIAVIGMRNQAQRNSVEMSKKGKLSGYGMRSKSIYGMGKSACIQADGLKKVHTEFDDGVEMVEEYDLKTDVLKVRKFRTVTELGGQTDWVFEIGSAPKQFKPSSTMLIASPNNVSVGVVGEDNGH
eukprot:TRINITY_DN1130_c2_g1_i2.p2 TRINITY_DN1130_c2_g1~~TRINITY_DN1130_c2_g1_i2.p2  ORF type:complete len:148 (-),score=31.93 TRINITY_DN1130_c2_g1_i2:436-879(-)